MQRGQLPHRMFVSCVCPFFVLRVHVVSAPSQEYILAHIDKPDTLAGAEQALKKHEDFMSTMEANQDKIDGTLLGGQRLVDGNNLYAGKVQDKMDSIRERSVIELNCLCLWGNAASSQT